MAIANWARSDDSYPSYRNDIHFLTPDAILTKVTSGQTLPSDTTRDASVAPSTHQVTQSANPQLRQACDSSAQRWQRQLDPGFNVFIATPFVIVGDLPLAELQRHYQEVVLPTTHAIQHCYSKTSIQEPVVLMLFATERSYRINSRKLFAQRNASVYGYYKPSNRTVAINLESGLGTLVHELTHAILDFDFQDLPLWLNEGIASLHEQATFSTEQHSPRIVGQINWRYPIVRDAIRSGRLVPIETLLSDSEGFRGAREGVNYAHARYLCMYLQRKHKLVPLYQSMRDNTPRSSDAGAELLQDMFPGQSWTEINHDFRQWLLSLNPTSPTTEN